MPSPKVALVTAGSAGLGAAIAKVLYVDAGMSIVVNYANNKQRAEEFVAELQKAKSSGTSEQQVLLVQADTSNKESIKELVKSAVEGLGRLDVVVSNVCMTIALVQCYHFSTGIS